MDVDAEVPQALAAQYQPHDADDNDEVEVLDVLHAGNVEEETQASRDSGAADEQEANIFDGEVEDSDESNRTAMPIRELALRRSSSLASDVVHKSLPTAVAAQLSSASPEPGQSSAASSSGSMPPSSAMSSTPATARPSRRRPRSTSPALSDVEGFPLPATRARATLEKQRQQVPFTPGPRAAEQVLVGTSHLRRSKRLRT
jgi:hypothetical protein